MKYMGSKRAMLSNGLGELLIAETSNGIAGFVDIFSGSAAVSTFVATRSACKVTAVDLQTYSQALAAAVLLRTCAVDADSVWRAWSTSAAALFRSWQIEAYETLTVREVLACRARCALAGERGPITAAYGGYYFSEWQAGWFDALRSCIPAQSAEAEFLCCAALVAAASKCAASPGHTAQPLQPTRRSVQFIAKAWALNPTLEVESSLRRLAMLHARMKGEAVVADANEFAWSIEPKQVVFVDPPYSAVQYSRFYHVLETVATGSRFDPFGSGRYPPVTDRPTSKYSMKGEAEDALTELFMALADRESTCIVTYPKHECSNGLSAAHVEAIAANYFSVKRKDVASVFSTLGGTSRNAGTVPGRAARKATSEAILVLRPRH